MEGDEISALILSMQSFDETKAIWSRRGTASAPHKIIRARIIKMRALVNRHLPNEIATNCWKTVVVVQRVSDIYCCYALGTAFIKSKPEETTPPGASRRRGLTHLAYYLRELHTNEAEAEYRTRTDAEHFVLNTYGGQGVSATWNMI